ncbi:MAG: hypothetical protein ACRELT_13775, partial [Longimicrobiales bacterium]
VTLGLTQSFEAKYRSTAAPPPGGGAARAPEAADTLAVPADSAAAADSARARQRSPGAGDTLGGVVLQRREQVATLSLLEISTQALVYDFVRARSDFGLVNTQLRNSLRSDLLRGMQVSFTHDLFRTTTDSAGIIPRFPSGRLRSARIGPLRAMSGTVNRSFAPHLRAVNASFSINADSWLFRVLGLGSRDTASSLQDGAPLQTSDPLQAGPAVDRTEPENGMIGTSRRTAEGAPRGSVGSWNASVNYSLFRPRSAETGGNENQMVTGNMSFQPTENWTLRWSTGYSITTNRFTDHSLTLTRTLHDWDANFDFVKAQNGNFSMQFRVHLRANPDVKLDYHQNDVRGLQTN